MRCPIGATFGSLLITREFFEGLRKPSAAVEAMLSRYRLQFPDTEDATTTATASGTAGAESHANILYRVGAITITIPLLSLTLGYLRAITAPDNTLNGDGTTTGAIRIFADGLRTGELSIVRVTNFEDEFRLAVAAGFDGQLLATIATVDAPTATENTDGSIVVTLGSSSVTITFDDPPVPAA